MLGHTGSLKGRACGSPRTCLFTRRFTSCCCSQSTCKQSRGSASPVGTEPGITRGHRAQHRLRAQSPASPTEMGCGSRVNRCLDPAQHHQQTPISLARAAAETEAPFWGRKDEWTDGHGKLSSLWSPSHGPDSSPGAVKPLSINKVASKCEPKPPWLNEALNHVLKSCWRRTTYFSV